MARELSNDSQNVVCSSAAGWVWAELLEQGRYWHGPGLPGPSEESELG